jgi:hypothetical protein
VGYLPGFDEDVFISYAHNDDDTYAREPKGWVAQLHSDLEKRVKVHLGAQPRLWRDCEIRNNEDFDKKISKRLVKTATLLSVLSPSFFQRKWCIRELEEFASYAERTFGIRIDDEKWRIFKVEKVPVDRNILPSQLQGFGSYKFHGPDPQHQEKVHEFRPQLGGEYTIRYFEEMDELAKDIATVLREIGQRAQGAMPAAAPGIAVYLAESSVDLHKEANEIRRDLKDRGYVVLPTGDLPCSEQDFKGKVRAYLKRSVLSVHLIGKEYGSIPQGGTDKSNAWLQLDLAMERGDAPNFMRLIWMPSHVESSDGRQQKFIKYLREDPSAQKGADVLETTLEDLKTTLQEKLLEVRERQRNPRQPTETQKEFEGKAAASTKRASDEPLRIYIMCDQLDEKSTSLLGLKKFLFSQGYEPIVPSENDDESEALREHNDNLAICDACLIYYGQGSEKWFGTKLRDLRKILSRREQPVLAKAVYLAPPETVSKSELETHEAIVLRGSETFSPEVLTAFLNRLRGAA